jgi:serine/threonine protein kinase
MPIASENELLATLVGSQLLEETQLDELTQSLCARFPSPHDLLRYLTLSGWLTQFQGQQLLQGRGGQLRVGPYVLLEQLGEGGMGEVYKARHDRLKRVVALKVLSKHHLANERILERFKREAQAAAQLTHPNIVTVFDAGQSDDTHFLAMEFLEGADLGHLIQAAGALPLAQACDYIRQAALGLQHAHEHGLVHRDVKPANLFVRPPERDVRSVPQPRNLLAAHHAAVLYEGGTIKVLDLGAARLHSPVPGGNSILTREGILVGTLDYIAPEQCRDSHRVDHRADLYSLGCTLYHLLSGVAPFGALTSLDKLLQHTIGELPSLQALRPDVPGALAGVVARLTAKSPEDRYQSAAEVANVLGSLLKDDCALTQPNFGATCAVIAPTVDMPSAASVLVQNAVPAAAQDSCEWPTLCDTPALEPVQRKRRRLVSPRFALAVASTVVGAALAVAVVTSRFFTPAPLGALPVQGRAKHDKPLPFYIPEDSRAVLSLNRRELLAAPIFQKAYGKSAPLPIVPEAEMEDLRHLFGYDAEADVDEVRVTCGPDNRHQHLVWLRGRFDQEQFKVNAGSLQEADAKTFAPFTLYKFYYWEENVAEVATDGRSVVYSQVEGRTQQSLRDALAGFQPQLLDRCLSDLLAKVDKKQTIWFAASMTSLRCKNPVQDNDLNKFIEPFFVYADRIAGGLRCGENAEATIYVHLQDVATLEEFELTLRDLIGLSQKLATERFTSVRLRPLAKLVATGKIARSKDKDWDFELTFKLTPQLLK